MTTELCPDPTLALPSDKNAERLSSALALVDTLARGQRDLGDMAAERAASNDVKDFAAKLRAASDEDVTSLQKLAEDGHMSFADARADPIYKATDAAARDARSRLEGLKDVQFDAAFLDLEPRTQALLGEVTREALDLATDTPMKAYLERVSADAKADEIKSLSMLPVACGGAGALAKEQSVPDVPASYVAPNAGIPDTSDLPDIGSPYDK